MEIEICFCSFIGKTLFCYCVKGNGFPMKEKVVQGCGEMYMESVCAFFDQKQEKLAFDVIAFVHQV